MGDALLDLVISDVLYQRFDKAREGELSRMRSTLVREQTLHQVDSWRPPSRSMVRVTGIRA